MHDGVSQPVNMKFRERIIPPVEIAILLFLILKFFNDGPAVNADAGDDRGKHDSRNGNPEHFF